MTSRFDINFFNYFQRFERKLRIAPLNLGGISASGGGLGGPPGGFQGQLPQTKISYDKSEAASSGFVAGNPYNPSGILVSGSLLDNLNHIRYRLQVLEDGTLDVYDNGTLVASGITIIDFNQNLGVTLISPTRVRIDASGGGSSTLEIQENDGTIASNVTILNFEGSVDVLNEGGGKVTVTVTASGTGTDEKAKVSANDTTSNYLENKIVAGTNVNVSVLNEGANEQLQISATISGVDNDEKVKVSSNDTTTNYLENKLTAGNNINITVLNEGANESVQISTTASGGVTDHGVLTGLGDDDHTQYLTSGRHNLSSHVLGTNVPHDTFLGLTDSPSSYTGQSGKSVVVNQTEDGLEFITLSGVTQSGIYFTDLVDTPTTYAGEANKFVRVSNTENGLVFTDVVIASGRLISAKVIKSFVTSLPNQAWTQITQFGTGGAGSVVWDTDNMYYVGDSDRLTIHTPGKYIINGYFEFETAASGVGYIRVRKNDSTVIGQEGPIPLNKPFEGKVTITVKDEFETNDFIAFQAWQNSGGFSDILSGGYASATKLSGDTTVSGSDTYKAKVSSNDTTENYLQSKLTQGTGISITVLNEGGNESLQISSTVSGGGASALNDLTDVIITTPQNGEVLQYNGSQWINTTLSGVGAQTIPYVNQALLTVEGTLSVMDSPLRIYNNTGENKTITEVFLAVDTAPVGSAIIADVHKNGTTIFTTQANRPQIAASANTGNTLSIDVPTWADGEYLTLHLDQVGSSTAGSDLVAHIIYNSATVSGSGTSLAIQENDTPIANNVTILNFEGGVDVLDEGSGKVTITISGSGGAPTTAEYVVTSSDGTLSSEINIPGFAGHPDKKPASPNTQDDEFDSSTLDAKWTKTSDAANDDVDTTWKSHAYANFTGNQSYNLSQDYAPGGDFSLTACFHLAARENYQGCHIYAYDNDESDGVRATYEYGGGYASTLSTKDSTTWTYNRSTLSTIQQNKVYLHLQVVSNLWSVWYSFDGLSFFRVGTYSKTFTVHHIEVLISQAGSSIPCRVGIDWVRRDWITL